MANEFKSFFSKEKEGFVKENPGIDVKAKVYKKPPPPPPPSVPENLFDDFVESSETLDSSMYELGLKIISGEIVGPVLYKTTPGIGKTEAALHLACQVAKADKICFFSSATREMAWQISDRMYSGDFGNGLRPIVIDGRHDGYTRKRLDKSGAVTKIDVKRNCHNYDKVEIAHKYGYPVYKYVCEKCPLCPHYKDASGHKTGYDGACQYYRRMWEALGWHPVYGPGKSTPVFLMTHHMMANFHTDSESMKDRIDLSIYDEDPTMALRTIVDWPKEEIEKKLIYPNMRPFRNFLEFVMDKADFYRESAKWVGGEKYYKTNWTNDDVLKAFKEAKYMDSTIIFGKSLALLLKHCAELNEVDLMGLLEMTSSMDTGLDSGGLMDINVSQSHILPKYKEPELAEELKNIVLDAEKGIEKAYKVSLRYNPPVASEDKKAKVGWSIIWDEVRQVNNGKSIVKLDAYGEKLISDRLMGRPVDVREVYCKVRENVNVTVFPEVNTSKKSMDSNKDEIFNTYVDPELRKIHNGDTVLFYTQKSYVSWLEYRIKSGNYDFGTFVIKYFWQDRGDDSYGDFDNLFIVGTPWSNIIGERNFCNALFHGEEPIDWSTGIGYVPNDPRVKAHQEARQEKEMLQALFRIRPSKPRVKPQNILIFSKMKLPLEFEMPGATTALQVEPSVDIDGIASTIRKTYKKFGCWTDYFISFYSKIDNIFNWFDEGALDSGEEFPCTYEELAEKFKLMGNKPGYEKYKESIFSVIGLKPKEIDYRGKKVSFYGDEEKFLEILDALRLSTKPEVDEGPGEASEGPKAETPPDHTENDFGSQTVENEPEQSAPVDDQECKTEDNCLESSDDTTPEEKLGPGNAMVPVELFWESYKSDKDHELTQGPVMDPDETVVEPPDPPPDEE